MTARHTRSRISRKASHFAFGALAAGTLILVPNVANADPQPSIEQVKAQLDKLYQQAADANEQYNAAQDAEGKLQGQINGINSQISAEQAQMADTSVRLGSMAAAQYRAGGIDPSLQLMMQSDPGTILDVSATVGRLQENNAATLKLLAQEKADLAAKAKDAAAKMQLLDKNTKDAAAKRAAFDADVAKAQALLGSLQDAQRQALAAQQAQDRAAALAAAQAAAASHPASSSPSSSSSSSSSGSSSGSSGSIVIPPVSGRAADAVAFAQAQLGKPYIFGATGPGGYDCSGLTQAAWRAAGVSIPRTATAQMQGLNAVPASQAQPGDLVFFYGNSSYVNHVGLYIGNGEVIHAPHPGSVVEIIPVSYMPVVSYARPA